MSWHQARLVLFTGPLPNSSIREESCKLETCEDRSTSIAPRLATFTTAVEDGSGRTICARPVFALNMVSGEDGRQVFSRFTSEQTALGSRCDSCGDWEIRFPKATF